MAAHPCGAPGTCIHQFVPVSADERRHIRWMETAQDKVHVFRVIVFRYNVFPHRRAVTRSSGVMEINQDLCQKRTGIDPGHKTSIPFKYQWNRMEQTVGGRSTFPPYTTGPAEYSGLSFHDDAPSGKIRAG